MAEASFLSSPFPSSPVLLVISLSSVPYLSPLERERGLCEGESVMTRQRIIFFPIPISLLKNKRTEKQTIKKSKINKDFRSYKCWATN